MRVVLDRRRTLRQTARILAPPGDVLVFAAPTATRKAGPSDERLGVARIERIRVTRSHLDLPAVFARLAELEVNDVLVEAGSRLAGALFAAGLVDEWLLYIAPKLLGKDAKPVTTLARLTKLEAAPEFELLDSKTVGPDVRLRRSRAERESDVHRHRAGSRSAQAQSTRARVRPAPKIAASRWDLPAIARERLNLGDSICVDGVCLTVAELGAASFHADVSGETLRVTTLGAKRDGARVNLEPALRAGDSLGGHWVSGHVDGVAEVLATCARRTLAARGIRGTEAAGALHRAQGFGDARWREPHRERGGWREVLRESHSAHARSHHSRCACSRCARQPGNRPAGSVRRAA